jgi:hypothetical protein
MTFYRTLPQTVLHRCSLGNNRALPLLYELLMPDYKSAIHGVTLKNMQVRNIHTALTNAIINYRRKLRF